MRGVPRRDDNSRKKAQNVRGDSSVVGLEDFVEAAVVLANDWLLHEAIIAAVG
jgi:hypothetical protein